MSPPSASELAPPEYDEKQIADTMVEFDLDEADGYQHNIKELMELSRPDFKTDSSSPAAIRAAEISRARITDKTRVGHESVIRSFLTYHFERNPDYKATAVMEQTPHDVTMFITQKCGEKESGFEGCKYSTAVSIRAALTLWYSTLRPNEGTEWRYNEKEDRWHGLPTRSRVVSEFMIGLEKIKARAGDASQSARALTADDMRRLHAHCMRLNQSEADRRWGIVRWHAYIHAFLMVLRSDEVLKLTFDSFNILIGEREHFDLTVGPRKTSQTSGGHKYDLHANDRDPALCPMRPWIQLSTLYGPSFDKTGPLYHRVDKYGAVMAEPVTSGVLSRWLAADMQAIGNKAWAMYGTHSFRRGGCQYRVKVKGWSIDMVAAWGGWSQMEAVTMFRYYFSPNDNHEYLHEYDRNLPKRVCA